MHSISQPSMGKSGNTEKFCGYLKIIAVLFLVLLIISCGKKGPPVPPQMLPLPAVNDLDAKIVNDSLELNWTFKTEKNAPAPDGFWVYRSKKPVADSKNCVECPDFFEKVSDMATAFSLWGRKENRFNYLEKLENGYVFRYKVIAYTDKGLTSEWSNTVEVVTESILKK